MNSKNVCIFFLSFFPKVENVFGSMMASEDTLFSQKKINANVKGLKKILESHVKKNYAPLLSKGQKEQRFF